MLVEERLNVGEAEGGILGYGLRGIASWWMEVSSGKRIRRMKGLTEVETAPIFDYAQEQFDIEASLVLHFYQFVSSQDFIPRLCP